MMRNDRFNSSGYKDPTAHEALRHVTDEEKRKDRLIKVLKYIIVGAEFELTGRICIRDTRTGREWR